MTYRKDHDKDEDDLLEDEDDDEGDERPEVHRLLGFGVAFPQRDEAMPRGDQEREDHQAQDVAIL